MSEVRAGFAGSGTEGGPRGPIAGMSNSRYTLSFASRRQKVCEGHPEGIVDNAVVLIRFGISKKFFNRSTVRSMTR